MIPLRFRRLLPDPYIALIIGMVVLASILPARGVAAIVVGWATQGAIALLFFLYGARLSSAAVVAGVSHWRLQLTVLGATFVLFPLLGVVLSVAVRPLLGPTLASGVLFLCLLPSTVQSSIAFTSIGRGNVPAALCSASVSNLLGIVVTPLFVGWLMAGHGGFSAAALRDICLQLLAPFAAGQLLRRWLGPWIATHKRLTGYVDRASILLVVYSAFSEGVVGGLWQRVSLGDLLMLLVIDAMLLALVLLVTTVASRRLGFTKEDEVTIVFCGSKKSLASGLPMANVLFAASTVGVIVLPLMLFHQIQLMACAVLARRYGARATTGVETSH